MENAASWPYATMPRLPKKSLMLTDAGIWSGVSRSMKGTKKLPHIMTKEKTVTTDTPGPMRGRTMRSRDWNAEAPSVQAASSSSFGTPSMKFFISQMAKGSWDAAKKRIVPCMVSIRSTCTKSA